MTEFKGSDQFAEVNGVRLHYVEAGPSDGPLVVLVHGFPDFWYGWRNQIPALAMAGFRVIAFDMRGYNLSDKPSGVRSYALRTLVDDVAALIRACSGDGAKARVVGHDWGAGVVWAFAMKYPDLVERVAVLNGPHPERLLSALKRPEQLAKSWYMFFFQLPWLPEAWIRRNDFALLRRTLQDEPKREGAVTAEDMALYIEAFSKPGVLTASVNYYRAMFRSHTNVKMRPIAAPVLVVWGDADPHLGAELAEPNPKWVQNARVEHLPGASHWVQHDQPERVNELLIEFLGPDGAASR